MIGCSVYKMNKTYIYFHFSVQTDTTIKLLEVCKNAQQGWIGGRVVSYLDCLSGGPVFKPRSCQNIFMRCFSVFHLYNQKCWGRNSLRCQKMCLLAWKCLKTYSHKLTLTCDKMVIKTCIHEQAPYVPVLFRRRSKSCTTSSGESAEVNVSDHD